VGAAHDTSLTLREPRWVHIMHHDPDSPHSLVGDEHNGKSPSMLAGGGRFTEMLSRLSAFLNSADLATTREYRERGVIVRLSLLSNGQIEKTILTAHQSLNGHKVITSFDNYPVAKALQVYGK
jgi:hypothetical protein